MSDNELIVPAIKGMNSDMTCRGFQFEPGKAYEHTGTVQACGSGFHACPTDQHPLSVFGYYAPAGSRFFEVTVSGKTSVQGDKIAAARITIGVEITISDLVKRAWDWVWARCTLEDGSSATGTQGAASATGYQGAASATGTRGAASATGDQGAASATGTRGAASATGTRGAASATGDQGAASATGYQGAASATGDQGAASATGYQGRASGKTGNALFAVEREPYPSYKIMSVACGIVGQDGIEPDRWYACRDGKLVEVAE